MKSISFSLKAVSALALMAAYGVGIPAKATTTLYSVVNADGTKARAQGGKATIHLGTGTYEVDFNRDLTFCSWLAVPGTPGASAEGAAYATTALRAGHSAGIFVETFNGSDGSFADHNFHAVVMC